MEEKAEKITNSEENLVEIAAEKVARLFLTQIEEQQKSTGNEIKNNKQ